MKVAVYVCVALLAVVIVQAEDEMGPLVLADDTRVANGRPATPRQFPYMAYIETLAASGSVAYRCSGTLITRSAVLTSAWCASGYNRTKWIVRLGSIYRTGEDPNAWTVESIWMMCHPKYNKKNGDNAIAIIHLPGLAPLNDFIQPVHLLTSPVNSSYIGRQGIVSGWGLTHPESGLSDVLRWAEVLVIPNHHCKNFSPSFALTDRQLCAGSFNTTVWWYDIGAPLVINTRGKYIQIGMFTRLTTKEYNTSHPAIYTRVTSYMDWLKLNTESDW